MVRGDLVISQGAPVWTEIVDDKGRRPLLELITLNQGEIAMFLTYRDDERCVILSVHGQVTVLNHYVTRLEHDR